jgi:hypothetical protein
MLPVVVKKPAIVQQLDLPQIFLVKSLHDLIAQPLGHAFISFPELPL